MKGALQRNESVADKATFHPELFIMDDVPEQLRGMSGHHTIHNAWIVALELVPNPQYRFVDVDYADMYRMARAGVAGLLNWKGIAVTAWLGAMIMPASSFLVRGEGSIARGALCSSSMWIETVIQRWVAHHGKRRKGVWRFCNRIDRSFSGVLCFRITIDLTVLHSVWSRACAIDEGPCASAQNGLGKQ